MFKNSFLMLLAALALNAAPAAWGQAWPTRPVRIVVGFPPGGMADTLPRRLQDALGTALGEPVVIDNKPGGAGVAGVLAITQARDDHTDAGATMAAWTSCRPARKKPRPSWSKSWIA